MNVAVKVSDRGISNVQGVVQVSPVDVVIFAPAGSETNETGSVDPRVAVAHPETNIAPTSDAKTSSRLIILPQKMWPTFDLIALISECVHPVNETVKPWLIPKTWLMD